MTAKEDHNNDGRKSSLKSAIKRVSNLTINSRNSRSGSVPNYNSRRSRSNSITHENTSLLKSALRARNGGENSENGSNESFATNSERTPSTSSPTPSEFRFAPEVITSIREYCNQEPPNFLLINSEQPLYEPVNFKLDKITGRVIRDNIKHNDLSSPTSSATGVPLVENDSELLRKKVRLESLKISKYHLNGFITCASLSMDQNCYIRVSYDNWTTFQMKLKLF